MPKFDFIDIILRHECSTVNLLLIFRTTFPKNTSGRLPLDTLRETFQIFGTIIV